MYPVAHSTSYMGESNPEPGREVVRVGGRGLAYSSTLSQYTLLSIGPPGQLGQSLDVTVDPTVLTPQISGLGTHSAGH